MMTRMILAPVDFSEASLLAWEQAGRLAQTLGARLEAVHVAPFALRPDRVRAAALSPKRRAQLKNLLARTYPGAAAVHLEEGDVVLGILRTAGRRKASMIAMASGGRTGLKRLYVPSITEEAARCSSVPVLALQGPGGPIRSILAPVNLKPYALAGMRRAEELARALGAELTLLFVDESAGARGLAGRRLELEVAALRSPVKIAIKVAAGRPIEEILKQAPRHGLVVMTVHRKGIFRDAVLGSTAEQVLRRARVPVLSVPPS